VEPTFIVVSGYKDEDISVFQSTLVNHYDFAIIGCDVESIVKLFQDASIPVITFGVTSKAQELAAYDCWLGSVGIDEYACTAEGARTLYEDHGCRNFMWCGMPVGASKVHDLRTAGFEDYVRGRDDAELVVESLVYPGWPEAISAACASYPEIDAIGVSGLNEAIYNCIVSEGLEGYVKVVGSNVSEYTGDAFDAGYLVCASAGDYVQLQIAFLVAWNYALTGENLIGDRTDPLLFKNVIVHNREEYDEYVLYFRADAPVFDEGDILEMCTLFHPEFSSEDLRSLGSTFGLPYVTSKLSK